MGVEGGGSTDLVASGELLLSADDGAGSLRLVQSALATNDGFTLC